MLKNILLLLIILSTSLVSFSQDSDSLMRVMQDEDTLLTKVSSFKSSRLILSQTTTMVKGGDLDFKVIHRFGDIAGTEGGAQTFFGFDNSSDIYIGFDYGISDRVNIAFGRSKYEQLLDLQIKYLLLEQTSDRGSPISASILAKVGFTPYKVQTTVFDSYSNRFSYFTQAIVSRRFSSRLSLQLSPGLLFRNVVLPGNDEKILFSTGIAGRYKLTKRFGIVADYYLINSEFRDNHPTINFYTPLGVGFEFETGGHVFTLNFANAKAIAENNFLPNSTSSWGEGEFRFGFTISRMFTLKSQKVD